jgi:hypothetical protein
MSEHSHLPRIRVGESFARRDETGTLVETGWIDPEDGREHVDVDFVSGKTKLDPSNPAAAVPWNQQWV